MIEVANFDHRITAVGANHDSPVSKQTPDLVTVLLVACMFKFGLYFSFVRFVPLTILDIIPG
jgi:hypothetical protein